MSVIDFFTAYLFHIATIILGIITAYLTYLQIKHSKKLSVRPENVIIPHKDVKIFKGRPATVELLSEITSRAKEGDTVFGHCNLCTDYPKDFYIELLKAVSRGANILFIIRRNPDSERFLKYLLELKKLNLNKVKILTTKIEYIRMLGIMEKEVVVALPLEDEFLGIYFSDSRVTRYLTLAFNEILKFSKEVGVNDNDEK